ncbi:plasmid mobilization protein, partial [Acinetobacter baumannii]|nr:plasmid mobilization protein [Acinetobacter baumannii]
SLEVMYYLNYLIKNAKNKEKLEKDFSEIIKIQEPILHQEGWNLNNMNRKLRDSEHNSTPRFEFEVHSQPNYPLPMQNKPPQPEQPKPKSDDYDYGGPGF